MTATTPITTAPFTPAIASRLPHVGTTIFSVMSALAAQHQAVNLGQGFPDFECDPRLIDAVTAAMRSGHNQYPPMPGVPALRQAVAEKIERLYGRQYSADSEVTITAGATQALLTVILAIVHPGDEVIVLEPCYDSYVPNIE
ncbi:MAG: aminotransferase class I/II-fold pyridoxal phosphate-dependent enzyme, partial [Burkholderiaceae bacterium]|nr:aminotransferase class I/II-fold pyridoxal phosphate-dependent enzyme [Burkholderiaceae bacterium]